MCEMVSSDFSSLLFPGKACVQGLVAEYLRYMGSLWQIHLKKAWLAKESAELVYGDAEVQASPGKELIGRILLDTEEVEHLTSVTDSDSE